MAVPTTQQLLDANRTQQKAIYDQLAVLIPLTIQFTNNKVVDATEAAEGMKNSQRLSELRELLEVLQESENGLVERLATIGQPYSVNVPFALRVNEIGKDETEYATGEN